MAGRIWGSTHPALPPDFLTRTSALGNERVAVRMCIICIRGPCCIVATQQSQLLDTRHERDRHIDLSNAPISRSIRHALQPRSLLPSTHVPNRYIRVSSPAHRRSSFTRAGVGGCDGQGHSIGESEEELFLDCGELFVLNPDFIWRMDVRKRCPVRVLAAEKSLVCGFWRCCWVL